MRFSDGALRLGASSDHALSRCLAPGYPSVRRTGVKLCSVWLLHQQAEPHVVVNIQFAADEAEFDRKLGWFIGQQKLHEYVRGDLSFLAGYNQEEVPSRFPDNIKSIVYALSDSARWWHEYRMEVMKSDKK